MSARPRARAPAPRPRAPPARSRAPRGSRPRARAPAAGARALSLNASESLLHPLKNPGAAPRCTPAAPLRGTLSPIAAAPGCWAAARWAPPNRCVGAAARFPAAASPRSNDEAAPRHAPPPGLQHWLSVSSGCPAEGQPAEGPDAPLRASWPGARPSPSLTCSSPPAGYLPTRCASPPAGYLPTRVCSIDSHCRAPSWSCRCRAA